MDVGGIHPRLRIQKATLKPVDVAVMNEVEVSRGTLAREQLTPDSNPSLFRRIALWLGSPAHEFSSNHEINLSCTRVRLFSPIPISTAVTTWRSRPFVRSHPRDGNGRASAPESETLVFFARYPQVLDCGSAYSFRCFLPSILFHLGRSRDSPPTKLGLIYNHGATQCKITSRIPLSRSEYISEVIGHSSRPPSPLLQPRISIRWRMEQNGRAGATPGVPRCVSLSAGHDGLRCRSHPLSSNARPTLDIQTTSSPADPQNASTRSLGVLVHDLSRWHPH